MKRPRLVVGLVGLAAGATWSAWRRQRKPAPEPNLAELNDEFHAVYGRLRTVASHQTPVLVLVADTLTLLVGDSEHAFSVTSSSIEIIKAAAHAPVAVFALAKQHAAQDAASARALLQHQLHVLHAARQEAERALVDPIRDELTSVLDRSHAFLEQLRERGGVDDAQTTRFGAALGPSLLRLIERATELQLARLHEATETALAHLGDSQRDALEVVVAGAHQARARSLPLQYFQKRFGEAAGEEKRVSYAEAATDVAQARTLVGTRKLDRVIAKAFFGDPRRLQRDVLGDAATKLLAASELELFPTPRS